MQVEIWASLGKYTAVIWSLEANRGILTWTWTSPHLHHSNRHLPDSKWNISETCPTYLESQLASGWVSGWFAQQWWKGALAHLVQTCPHLAKCLNYLLLPRQCRAVIWMNYSTRFWMSFSMFNHLLMQTWKSEEKEPGQEVPVLTLTFHFNPSGNSELSADTGYSFFIDGIEETHT